MKKILSLLCFFFAVFMLSASPIDTRTAKNVAMNFWKSNGGVSSQEWTNITPLTPFTEFYIWSNEQGFVIVSGDNCVVPILGYSLHNAFNHKMPDHIANFLDGLNQEIAYYKSIAQESQSELSALWESLINGTYIAQSTTSVSPLLTTTWDQIEIYDMTGRCIAFEKANENSHHIFTVNANGIYLVKIGTMLQRKVMIIQ